MSFILSYPDAKVAEAVLSTRAQLEEGLKRSAEQAGACRIGCLCPLDLHALDPSDVALHQFLLCRAIIHSLYTLYLQGASPPRPGFSLKSYWRASFVAAHFQIPSRSSTALLIVRNPRCRSLQARPRCRTCKLSHQSTWSPVVRAPHVPSLTQCSSGSTSFECAQARARTELAPT